MEAVVHEPFGNVIHREAGVMSELARIQNAFMRHQPLVAGVENREEMSEFLGNVVGVKDGHFRGFPEAVRPHHGEVHPADGGDGGASPRRRRYGPFFMAQREVPGQEGYEVFRYADGPDAGTAAAVRHGKGFMQVQVADVRANAAGASQTYLGIHVGAVHVHLAAIGMDDVAEFLDCLFIYPVRGGVRDHDAGEIVLMGFRLGFQVCHVDVASFVAFDGHHLEAGHGGGCGICSVGGGGNEADIAVAFSGVLLVAADGQ